jgi:hypothetical protein
LPHTIVLDLWPGIGIARERTTNEKCFGEIVCGIVGLLGD